MNKLALTPLFCTQTSKNSVDPIGKHNQRPKSLRLAINAQCYECIYDKSDGGSWRQQVTACTCSKCPLFSVRPTTSSKKVAA